MLSTENHLDDILSDYLEETQERLDRISESLLVVESDPSADLTLLKRELHTLKGLSAMVDFHDISKLCHLMEDYLADAHTTGRTDWIQALLDGCDFIAAHTNALTRGTAVPVISDSILKALGNKIVQNQEAPVTEPTKPSASHAMIQDSATGLPEPKQQPTDQKRRFLIVDDNAINRELLLDILREYAACDVAIDGRQAVTIFQQALDKGQPYDAICLDIVMPELDGHVALETIRCIEHQHQIYGKSGVKVIMTTAALGEIHLVRAFKKGCQSYLPKPIDETQLIASLQKFQVIDAEPERPVLRFLDDVLEVFIKLTNGRIQPAEVVNESRIDINVLVEDVSYLHPNCETEILYKKIPMEAVVNTIDPQNHDGKYSVRFMWK